MSFSPQLDALRPRALRYWQSRGVQDADRQNMWQDVCVRVLRHACCIRNVEAYVFSTAKYKLYEHFASQEDNGPKEELVVFGGVAGTPEPLDEPDDPLTDEEAGLLREALASLDADEAQFIHLRFDQDRSLREIAAALNLTYDQAAYRNRKVITKLRSFLNKNRFLYRSFRNERHRVDEAHGVHGTHRVRPPHSRSRRRVRSAGGSHGQ